MRTTTLQETLLAEMRVRLGQAALCERRAEIELADAYGAVAANKLARVIRIDAQSSKKGVCCEPS